MYLRKNIDNKKGSYIAEAALTLPVFIICVIALLLVVQIIGICENIGFETAKTVKASALGAYGIQNDEYGVTASLCKLGIERNVRAADCRLTGFRVKNLDYMYTDNGIDDLIGTETEAVFNVLNPIGVRGRIIFSQSLLVRAFTGSQQDIRPLGAEDFLSGGKSEKVVVFLKYGQRFHRTECRYVKQEYHGEVQKLEMEREDAIRKGYTPCMVCGKNKNE